MTISTIERGTGRPDAYRNAKGEKIPGVTTITGRFGDKSALIPWAYNRGKEGLPLYESRDQAVEVGHAVHAAVEEFVATGREREFGLLNAALRPQAEESFGAFRFWWDTVKPEIAAIEIPLVSEVYQFAGTVDAIGKINGRWCVIDWKTSTGVYPDYVVQVAAYGIAWDELHPDKQIEHLHVNRFGKQGGYEHRMIDSTRYQRAKEIFRSWRAAYEFEGDFKSLLK